MPEKKLKSEDCMAIIFCSMLGVLFVFFFSYSTSSRYPDYFGGDTAQFLTVGKAWYEGRIPYKDIFDHKGPIIFLIDMLGFAIGDGNKKGVSIIQSVMMIFTVTAIYKIGRFGKRGVSYGILAVACSLVAMKANYMEGNSVEEYCVPFICWSTYGFVRYFRCLKYGRIQHDNRFSLLYGVTAGVCFMTRATNFVPVCGALGIVVFILLCEKEYTNLLKNAFSFVIGCAGVCLPFAVYFSIKGCFYDFLFGSFLYNIDYAKKITPWFLNASANDISVFLHTYFVFYVIFFAALIKLMSREYLATAVFLATGILEAVVFMSAFAFVQYPLVCAAQIVLVMNTLVDAMQGDSQEKPVALHAVSMIVSFMIISFLGSLIRGSTLSGVTIRDDMLWAAENKRIFGTHSERPWESLVDRIPDSERRDLIVFGGNDYKEFYLLNDIVPRYKYFVIQSWHASYNERIKEDIFQTFDNGRVKWILTDGTEELIRPILNERYNVYDFKDNMTLYRLCEYGRSREDFIGSGTVEDPYIISDQSDLIRLSDIVNAGYSFEGEYLLQTADIDLGTNIWIPAGIFGSERYFRGTYDGANHTISGLNTWDQPNYDLDHNGLFGFLEGKVLNLGIEDGRIMGDCVGGITSHGGDNAMIVNCFNRAEVIGNYRAGGVCDNLGGGQVILCVNEGSVVAPESAEVISYSAAYASAIYPIDGALNANYTGSFIPIELVGEDVKSRLNYGLSVLTEQNSLPPDIRITAW